MSVFDTFKNMTGGTIKARKSNPDGDTELQSWSFTFAELPKTLEELKALEICDLTKPQNTAAMLVLAYCTYRINKEESLAMIDFLNGPSPLTEYDRQLLDERFDNHGYVPFSYFEGAYPQNNYIPERPYKLVIKESTRSRYELNIGYYMLYLRSSGADSDRYIKLKLKPSTGEWFIYEPFIMVGIRRPDSLDPWA